MSISNSKGVNAENSNAVNGSKAVINSYGVYKCFFIADEKGVAFKMFSTQVSEERIEEVKNEYKEKLNGWFPKFNNGFELYLQNGNDWKKVNASEICNTLDDWQKPAKAWEGVPVEALDYLKSLPEFDASIFTQITGLEMEETMTGKEVEVKIGDKIYKAIIK